jgi:nitroreductase
MSVDTENLLAAITNRRSFKPKSLKTDEVPKEILEKIFEAARWAPSHGKTEPWFYTVYTGEGRKALGDAFGEAFRIEAEKKGNFTEDGFKSAQDKVWNVPVWIALTLTPKLKPDGTRAMPEEEEVIALACSVQNLHLMACSLGLGGQWVTGANVMHEHVQKFIAAPEPARHMGFFYLGWVNEEAPPASRREIEQFVRWKS